MKMQFLALILLCLGGIKNCYGSEVAFDQSPDAVAKKYGFKSYDDFLEQFKALGKNLPQKEKEKQAQIFIDEVQNWITNPSKKEFPIRSAWEGIRTVEVHPDDIDNDFVQQRKIAFLAAINSLPDVQRKSFEQAFDNIALQTRQSNKDILNADVKIPIGKINDLILQAEKQKEVQYLLQYLPLVENQKRERGVDIEANIRKDIMQQEQREGFSHNYKKLMKNYVVGNRNIKEDEGDNFFNIAATAIPLQEKRLREGINNDSFQGLKAIKENFLSKAPEYQPGFFKRIIKHPVRDFLRGLQGILDPSSRRSTGFELTPKGWKPYQVPMLPKIIRRSSI